MNNDKTITELRKMADLTRELLDCIERMRIFFEEVETVCRKYREPYWCAKKAGEPLKDIDTGFPDE